MYQYINVYYVYNWWWPVHMLSLVTYLETKMAAIWLRCLKFQGWNKVRGLGFVVLPPVNFWLECNTLSCGNSRDADCQAWTNKWCSMPCMSQMLPTWVLRIQCLFTVFSSQILPVERCDPSNFDNDCWKWADDNKIKLPRASYCNGF